MKKFLISCLIFAFIIMIFSGASIQKVYGDVEIRGVSVSPSIVDSFAQYIVYIVLHKDLNRGENLYIKFPSECTIPQSINKELVEIGGYKPSSVTVSGNTVILSLTEPILQNQGATTGGLAVSFSESIGIRNPTMPDVYSIEVWTTTEPNHTVYSFYIGLSVTDSAVKNVRVILSNSFAGKNSRYDVSFEVTNSGALLPGDYIDIYFPKGTILPSDPDKTKVLMNYANTEILSIQDRRVRVFVPESRFVPPGAMCSVFFLEEFGIINPESTGNFALQVATSKDTGLATSALYALYGTPIESLSVMAEPSSQKMNADYTIEFRTSQIAGGLQAGKGKINIKFSSAFTMPSFVKPGAILVNNVPCVTVTLSEYKVSITTPVEITANSQVKIFIKKEFGIINPENTASYEVFLNTSSDAVYVSDSISITPSIISKPQVTLSNTSAGQLSAYSITFTTGISGSLLPGVDRVNIVLPVGTTIPSVIPVSTITFNGIPTTLVEISGTTLTITAPVEVKASGAVIIEITQNAGLRNPVYAGMYHLYVFTTKETTPVQSDEYLIRNVPQTTVEIIPAIPDGLNNFYKTKPNIKLTASSAVDPNPSIFYYFDDNIPAVYNSTIVVPEGIHTLFYYAIDKDGRKEEVKSIQTKVDTIPPVISLITPKDNSVLSSFNCIVQGVTEVGATTKVNGNTVTVDSLGSFETSVQLSGSPDMINISAVDLAGNTAQLNITVYVDTTPPSLTINKPVMFQQINKLPLLVEGQTEPQAKVTINGNAAIVNEMGSFSYNISSLSEGLNNVEVITTDIAGNSTKRSVSVKYSKSVTIILQVGNTVSLINGQTYTLEAAPTITSSRTMVPLRFIGEAFGAEFTYEPTTKTIDITFGSDKIRMQIGKKTATVNGKEVVLDVAPFIVNGRTLVPIRFISETFGAEVIWQGTTKTVIINYPK